MQTTLGFENAPVAKRPKTQATLPAPPEYSVCSPDTPALYGRELKQYVKTIASVCTSPIPFEEYLRKRLSTEHVVWYSTLLSARMDSEERYPIDFDKLWPMLYSRRDNANRALEKTYKINDDFLPLEPPEVQDSRKDHRDILDHINSLSDEGVNSRRGPAPASYRLTLECAKSFSANAGTDAGRAVRDFFLKVHSVTEEFMLIDSVIRGTQRERAVVEENLLRTFKGEQDVVYLGFIQPYDEETDIYSIGHAKNIGNRIKDHRKKYGNFDLVYAKKTPYKQSCEQAIFKHPLVSPIRDGSLMQGDTELFKVFRNDGAILSLKNTIDQVCVDVCVAQGGDVHVTERQTAKTSEEMAHEIKLLEKKFELETLASEKRYAHEIRIMEMKIELKRGKPPEPEPEIVIEREAGSVGNIVQINTPSAPSIVIWFESCTQPSNVHISSKVLLHSYNAFYGRSDDKVKKFNAKLRAVGVCVKKSVRSSVGDTSCVTSGVEDRCLRTDHPSFSRINWDLIKTQMHENMSLANTVD